MALVQKTPEARLKRVLPTSRGESQQSAEISGGLLGRGFLWGPLAVQSPAAGIDGGSSVGDISMHRDPSVASGSAMMVEMPSLSGTSDMSSGVISGFRRALVWADDGGAKCPSIVSR